MYVEKHMDFQIVHAVNVLDLKSLTTKKVKLWRIFVTEILSVTNCDSNCDEKWKLWRYGRRMKFKNCLWQRISKLWRKNPSQFKNVSEIVTDPPQSVTNWYRLWRARHCKTPGPHSSTKPHTQLLQPSLKRSRTSQIWQCLPSQWAKSSRKKLW